MAFTEALRLVVDADTRGAVQGIERLGATADRELSRSEKTLDKWGNRLTSLGAGMIAFGGAALVGLGAMAKASEDANLAQVKLQNTIDNMPKLAGASASEFTDLAESIQKVTAADADAIVEAEALLGTFNLTAQEIKGITPLVVDYARKFGVDMADAAVQVGKALDGQAGALKRNGVSIDEALFATDRYTAVQQALSDQVGGFAEAEGATFAGSLERLKNELGDLAEGVGGGAVDAFTSMFGAVESLTGALESVSPEAQNTIGKVATFGAVGLIAAGGISTLIGQIIAARRNFTLAAEAIIGMRGALLTLGEVGVVVGVLIGLREVLGTISDDAKRADLSTLENQLLDLADSGEASGATLTRVFGEIADSAEGAAQTRSDINALDEALASLTAKDPEAAAKAFRRIKEELEAMGVPADLIKDRFNDYNAALVETDTQSRTTGSAIDEATGAIEEQTDATEDAISKLEEWANKLQAQFDPLFAMRDALAGAQDAQLAVVDAQNKLTEAMAEGNADEVAESQRNYDDALRRAGDSVYGVQQAQLRLNDAIANGDVSLEDAQRQLYDWAIAQGFSGEQALIMAGQLGTATAAAQTLGAQDPVVNASLNDQASVPISTLERKLRELDGQTATVNLITRQSTILAGSTNIPLRAAGGPVLAGEAYIVGEHRPELFIPNENGMIWPTVPSSVPAGSFGGGSGPVVEETIIVRIGEDEIARAVRRSDRRSGR